MWVAVGMIGAAVVGGVASNAAQKSAAKKSTKAQDAATAEQQRQFDITQENFAPYKQIGEAAAPVYKQFLDGSGPAITADPLYKNQMKAASREALQRGAALGQSTASGSMQTRLAQLGDAIYNSTYQTKYKELTDAMKTGQGAAGEIRESGTVLGDQMRTGANAIGNIAQNRANTQSELYGDIAGAIGTTFMKAKAGNWWGDKK